MHKIAAIIMAAGQSSRFEGCKHLAQVNQQTVLDIAISELSASNIEHIFVVTGHWHNPIQAHLANKNYPNLSLLHNENWAEGLGNSIAYAVSTLANHYQAIIITLADQVALTSTDYQSLINLYSDNLNQTDIVCAHYQESRGVPALFASTTFAQLSQLSGDKGAKKLLMSNEFKVVEAPLPNAAIDIDTQQQLQNYLNPII